jgi:hypothetical protein
VGYRNNENPHLPPPPPHVDGIVCGVKTVADGHTCTIFFDGQAAGDAYLCPHPFIAYAPGEVEPPPEASATLAAVAREMRPTTRMMVHVESVAAEGEEREVTLERGRRLVAILDEQYGLPSARFFVDRVGHDDGRAQRPHVRFTMHFWWCPDAP